MPTAPLADELDRFFAKWKRDRPPTGGRFGDDDAAGPMRAAEWLAQESGLSESTISNVSDRRYRMTELRVADRLVTALAVPWLFSDGLLTIHPNPAAPAVARLECCDGVGPVVGYDRRIA